jgi:hypothetical protein
MKQKVQLFIENEEVDVFQDGSITIQSSIKDAKDSLLKYLLILVKTLLYLLLHRNNKIFKHYYDYDIVDGGFDARKCKRSKNRNKQ